MSQVLKAQKSILFLFKNPLLPTPNNTRGQLLASFVKNYFHTYSARASTICKLSKNLVSPNESKCHPLATVQKPADEIKNKMSLKNTIAAALKTATSSEVEIYWDSQDRSNPGPAYRETTGEKDQRESGPLELRGWAHVSGRKVEEAEVLGYNLSDYFTGADGAYAGPDQDGIYPILS